MYHLDNTSGVPEMPEPKDTQSISPRWFGESQAQGGISWPESGTKQPKCVTKRARNETT